MAKVQKYTSLRIMAKQRIAAVLLSCCLIFILTRFSWAGMVAVYGDSRTNDVVHRRVVKLLLEMNPAVVFHTGDLVDDGLSLKEWGRFNKTTFDLRQRAAFYPALGNHEKNSEYFFLNFELANNERWYSVDYEGVHFIVLDSGSDLSYESPQYRWLTGDLAGVPAYIQFRVVILHKPFFNAGEHYGEVKDGIRSFLLPLFKQYGVGAVFSGHDHNYQRFLHNGIYYIVTGGGGAALYRQKREDLYLQKFIKTYNFSTLTRQGDSLVVQVYNLDPRRIDTFSISPYKP